MSGLKGCLVAIAVLVLVGVALNLIFKLFVGVVGAVPLPVWIFGAVAILVWAGVTRRS